MKYILTLFFLFLVFFSHAQMKSFSIKGQVQSEVDSTALESATVYLERSQDSTLVTYTITDRQGRFQLEDRTAADSLQLFISYVGYQSYGQKIALDREEIDLGILRMSNDANALDEVVIKTTAPITIKKDTLEFNVSSFKTKKDATVEDLLKKLPGVEVDAEGNITVNGKAVNKILVNGKPFFGNDPTIATRNLTKEIIEKVQVTDTKTDAEAFSGETTDGEDKTINLTIKEENNKGIFGRLGAGAGTDERYEFAGLFNRFDNDQRISFLLGGNNINSAGFSFGEIQKMFGNARSMSMSSNGSFQIDGRSFGSGSGIVTSQNGGVNYADTFGKGVDISADYFFGSSDGKDASSTQRENFLPDRSFFTNSNTNSRSENDQHSFNLQFDVKVDTTLLINIRPNIQYATNKRNFTRFEETLDATGVQTNRSNTQTFTEGDNRNFSNDVDITKKFGSKGASLRITLDTEIEKQESEDFLKSTIQVFGDTTSTEIRDQLTDVATQTNSIYSRISYSHPLVAKKLFLEGEFSYRNDLRENVESTFDFNSETQAYDIFNTDLSTNFNYVNERLTPELGLSWRGEKMRLNVSAGYVFRNLENEDALRPQATFERSFEALETNLYVNYRFNQKQSLYFNYRKSNQPPSINQLQPFQDVSDPLNIVTGNPALKPSNRHQGYLGLNAFDWQKRTGFNLYAGFTVTDGQPTAKTTVDENFVRTTTFENVDGNYNAYLNGSYSKRVKLDTLRSLRMRLRLGTNINRAVNFFDGVQYASNTRAFNPNLQFTFEWDKVMDVQTSYGMAFTKNTYNLDALNDREFVTHRVGIETSTFFPKQLEWRNDINYNYNPNVAVGFQRSAWFWNSTLAYSILNDKGIITVKAYDILNQNTNARRTATENYIQDSQSLVLQQYFMLSFSWKFNSLGKKGETGDGSIFFFD